MFYRSSVKIISEFFKADAGPDFFRDKRRDHQRIISTRLLLLGSERQFSFRHHYKIQEKILQPGLE